MNNDNKIIKNLESFMKAAQERLKQHMDKEAQFYIGHLVVNGIIDTPDPNKGFMVDPNDFCKFLNDFYREYIEMMKLWERVDQVITPLSKVAFMPKDDITKNSDKPIIVN